MEKKKICTCSGGLRVVLMPVYYEHENNPSWRKSYTGTLAECESIFATLPDFIYATHEENTKARKWKAQEMLFLESIGKTEKANMIRAQYGF